MEQANMAGIPGRAYRKQAEMLPHVYFETDSSGKLLFLNPKGHEILGYTDADLKKGLLLEHTVTDHDRARFRDDFTKSIAGQALVLAGYTFAAKDGMTFSGLIYPQAIVTEGNITGTCGFLAVIDDQERLENLLMREQRRTEEYFELSATLLLRRDRNAIITEINKTGCEILECTEEEALGKDWIETFVLPEDRPAVRACFEDMISGNLEPYRHLPERRIVTKKGTVKLMNWRNRLMKTRQGDIAGVVSSGEDVTERLRLEKELRESEEKYRSIFHESRDGKVLVNAETGEIVECNREFERQTGRSSDELKRFKIWEIRSEKHVTPAKKAFQEIKITGDIGIISTEYQKPDGSITPIEFTSREVTISGVRYFQSISRDISSRIEAENRLRQSEAHFHSLYDQMLEGVIYVDTEGNFLSMNASAEKILGFTTEELPHYQDFIFRFQPVQDDGAPYTEDIFPGVNALLTGLPEKDITLGLWHEENQDYQWLSGTCVPEFREGETIPYRVFLTFTDITERRKTAYDLRTSEEKFSKIFEQAPDAIVISDYATGTILEANQSALEMSGYERDEFLGHQHIFNVWVDEEEHRRFSSILHEEGKVSDFEYEFRRKNGEIIFASLSVERLFLNGILCDISVQTDITERKRAEAALRESEEKFSKMFSSSPDAIVLTNLTNDVMTDINDTMLKITGYSRQEVIGHTAAGINLWKNPKERQRILSIVQRDDSIDNEELEFRIKNGEIRTFLFSARLLHQKGEKFLMSVLTDITERKQAEQALRESEHKFSTIFQTSPDAITMVAKDGKYQDVNQAFLDLFGFTREEVVGHTPLDLKLWIDNDERQQVVRDIEEKGEVNNREVHLRDKEGTIHTVLFFAKRITIGDQLVAMILIIDITDRVEAELALKESEQKFATAFEASPDSMALVSGEGRYVEVNRSFTNIFGYTRDDVIGKTADEIGFWAEPKERNEIRKKMLSDGRLNNEEYRARKKSGEIATILLSAEPIVLQGKHCTLSVATDITKRVEAERALKESEKKFSHVFHHLPEAITIADVNTGLILEANDSAIAMSGYERDQIIGQTLDQINLWVDKKARDRILAALKKQGEVSNEEIEFRRKNGGIITVLFSAQRMVINSVLCEVSIQTDITERKRAEKQLRESEEKFSAIFQTSPDSIIIIGPDGTYLDVNQAFVDNSGFSREEVIGRNAKALDFWSNEWDLEEVAQQIRTTGRVDDLEIHVLKKDGTECTQLFSAATVTVGNQQFTIGIATDITRRVEMEKALRESEEKFAKAFMASPDAIAISNPDGIFLEINDAFTSIFGYTREEVIGHCTQDFDKFASAEEGERRMAILNRDGRLFAEESVFRTKSGDYRTILFSMEEIIINGEPCFISVNTDITERKRAEEALRESEEKFAVAFHANPDPIAIADEVGVFIDVNDAFTRGTGFTREQIANKQEAAFDFFPIKEERDEILRMFYGEGSINNYECRMKYSDGSVHTVQFTVSPITLAGKKRYLGMTHDITERKVAEEALRQSEERFSIAFHSSPDAIIITSRDGKYLDLNDSFTRMYGYTREEKVGTYQTADNFVDPEASREIARIMRENHRVVNHECQIRSRDGRILDVFLSIQPIVLSGETCYLGTTHDITERKRIEEAARESEERFSIAFHSSPQMAIISDLDDSTYLEANEAFCKATGYTVEEVIGSTGANINLWVNRDDLMQFFQELNQKGSVKQGTYRMRMRNGEIRTWLCSAEEIRLYGKRAMLAVASDITERIMAEEKLKQLYEEESSLRQQLEEEMKRRAEFTRALVHELKTPLTPIVASSDALTELIEEEPLKSMAVNVNRGALNLNKRIDELLELAKSELKVLQLNPATVDPESLMRDIVSEMGPMAAKHEQVLKLDISEPLPAIEADPERIRQVISNLLTNSLKFTHGGGEITLRGSFDEDNVTIEVQDNGPGLTQGEVDRLFQPYYRKESDREHLSGLGLGLALCKTLVELHGGKIWATSQQGKGSVFSFTLPRKNSPRRQK